MLSLVYTNRVSGDHISFGDSVPLFFLSQKGMDGANATPILVKAPYQHGQTHLGANVDARLITIECAVVTENLSEFYALRRRLIHVLNPFQVGSLSVVDGEMRRLWENIQIVDAPEFKDKDHTSPDGIVYFSFSVSVPGNFCTDIALTTFRLIEVNPGFEFDLVFDQTVIFGDITSGKAILNNIGDAPAPLIISIPGPVTTPIIENLTTGEFIKVRDTISPSEVMYINTSFGNKTVEIVDQNGNIRNAFNYIDLNSTFFSLALGENEVKFSADVGNDTAAVSIYFKNLYLGL